MDQPVVPFSATPEALAAVYKKEVPLLPERKLPLHSFSTAMSGFSGSASSQSDPNGRTTAFIFSCRVKFAAAFAACCLSEYAPIRTAYHCRA